MVKCATEGCENSFALGCGCGPYDNYCSECMKKQEEFEQLVDEIFEHCLEQAMKRNPNFELNYERDGEADQ